MASAFGGKSGFVRTALSCDSSELFVPLADISSLLSR